MDTTILYDLGISPQDLTTLPARAPVRLFAQAYDMHPINFYFTTAAEFHMQMRQVKDWWRGPVDFKIEFIDGNDLDAALFKALCIDQSNADKFLEALDIWSPQEKINAFIFAREKGDNFENVANFIAICRMKDHEKLFECINEQEALRRLDDRPDFSDVCWSFRVYEPAYNRYYMNILSKAYAGDYAGSEEVAFTDIPHYPVIEIYRGDCTDPEYITMVPNTWLPDLKKTWCRDYCRYHGLVIEGMVWHSF